MGPRDDVDTTKKKIPASAMNQIPVVQPAAYKFCNSQMEVCSGDHLFRNRGKNTH